MGFPKSLVHHVKLFGRGYGIPKILSPCQIIPKSIWSPQSPMSSRHVIGEGFRIQLKCVYIYIYTHIYTCICFGLSWLDEQASSQKGTLYIYKYMQWRVIDTQSNTTFWHHRTESKNLGVAEGRSDSWGLLHRQALTCFGAGDVFDRPVVHELRTRQPQGCKKDSREPFKRTPVVYTCVKSGWCRSIVSCPISC